MPRAKLTQQQLDQAIVERERGRSCATIAKRFGVSRGAINYQCLKAGAVSPNQRRTPTPIEASSFVGRDGRTFRTFTQEDDDRLLQLRLAGMKPSQIAREMGRGNTSIRMRLLLLAAREEMVQ